MSTSGYSGATSRKTDRKSPSVNFMMFAFVTHATCLRPFSRACANAKRMIRSEAFALIGLTEIPDPGAICFDCRPLSSRITCSAVSVPASYSMPA